MPGAALVSVAMSWFHAVRRLVERHPLASDTALAVALAAFVQWEIWTSGGYLTASKAIYVPAGLLMTLPLAWRRRAPLAVAAVVMGALAVQSLAVGSAPTPDSPLAGWLLAIYSVAAHCDRVAALTGRCVQPRRRPCLDRRRRRPLSSRGLWQRLGRGTSRPPTPPVRARP